MEVDRTSNCSGPVTTLGLKTFPAREELAAPLLSGAGVAAWRGVRSCVFLILLLAAVPSQAQEWSLGVATGPFVFGDFAEHEAAIAVGDHQEKVRTTLSADTRPGLLIDVERNWNDRFSVRLESTAARAPMSAKSLSSDDDPSGEGVSLEVGTMDVLTFALAAVWRFNRDGAFRPYLLAGPAFALYRMDEDEDSGAEPLYRGTRGEAGVIGGAGLEWWWRPRVGVKVELADIFTRSPLRRGDFAGGPSSRLEIESPHNVHTSVGVRYRF